MSERPERTSHDEESKKPKRQRKLVYENQTHHRRRRHCLCGASPQSGSRADMVTDWNETAEAVIRASTPSPPIQIRALAM